MCIFSSPFSPPLPLLHSGIRPGSGQITGLPLTHDRLAWTLLPRVPDETATKSKGEKHEPPASCFSGSVGSAHRNKENLGAAFIDVETALRWGKKMGGGRGRASRTSCSTTPPLTPFCDSVATQNTLVESLKVWRPVPSWNQNVPDTHIYRVRRQVSVRQPE